MTESMIERVARAIRGEFCKRYQDSGARSWDNLVKFDPNGAIAALIRDEAIAAIVAYESEANARIAELEAALKPFAEVGADIADISTIAHDAPCVLKCENVSDFTLDASHFTQASDIYYEEKGANRSRKAYEGKL